MREVKDSGVEWLGEVPAGWELHRAKRLFRLTNDKGNGDLTLLAATQKHGMWPQDRLEGVVRVKDDTDLSKFRTVHKNDFVISLRSFQGGFERSDFEGVCSPAYQTFCAIEPIDYQFFKYLFKSSSFIDHMNSLTLGIREGKTIKFDDFATQVLPMPPLEGQRRIADYLDEKCVEIDRAISAAEQSIEELSLYRSARLEETIAKVSHEAPLEKLKYVLKESKDKSPDGIGEPLSITIAHGVLRSAELSIPNPTSSLVGAKVVHAGDLVFNKLKAYYGVMYVSPYTGLISPEYAVYQAIDTENTSLKYLEYVFHTVAVIDEFIIRISGVADGFRRLYTSDLFDIAVPVPSIEVQQDIVAELDDLYASIAESTEAKQAIIADLKAYKQSLIYETVTGKREV